MPDLQQKNFESNRFFEGCPVAGIGWLDIRARGDPCRRILAASDEVVLGRFGTSYPDLLALDRVRAETSSE